MKVNAGISKQIIGQDARISKPSFTKKETANTLR